MNEINNLRSTPQGRPSFNNQTIKMGLNTPVTLTDSKGTLSNYSITSGNGVNASVNGNDLTVSITSENYDKTLTFSRNFGARDVNIIYGSGGYQRVIYLASRRDPSPNFKLNFELRYADIEVEKQDVETGNKTQGDATFNGATFAIKDTNIDGVEIKANDYRANEIIKIIREWSGKTQEEFGKEINRTKNSIQLYEYGQRNYDFELLLKLAKKENLIITIEKK